MRAADIMQKNIMAVSPELPIASLEAFLSSEDISGAPVQDDRGNVIGIVSKTDLVRALSDREENDPDVTIGDELTVEDIMTPEVVTVAPDTEIKVVARQMLDGKLHRVLVAQDGEVLGIITTFDLLALLT